MTKRERVEQLRNRCRTAIVVAGVLVCVIPFLVAPAEEPVPEVTEQTETESEWDIIRWKEDTEEVTVESLQEITVEASDQTGYEVHVKSICESYGICPEVVMALIEVESSGNPDAVSNHNAIGLMQVMPKWHWDRMERLGVTDLKDPYSNILVGVDYLEELFDKYHELPIVLMCYNEGPSPELFEKIENGYISDYAKKIMERASGLQEATNEEL